MSQSCVCFANTSLWGMAPLSSTNSNGASGSYLYSTVHSNPNQLYLQYNGTYQLLCVQIILEAIPLYEMIGYTWLDKSPTEQVILAEQGAIYKRSQIRKLNPCNPGTNHTRVALYLEIMLGRLINPFPHFSESIYHCTKSSRPRIRNAEWIVVGHLRPVTTKNNCLDSEIMAVHVLKLPMIARNTTMLGSILMLAIKTIASSLYVPTNLFVRLTPKLFFVSTVTLLWWCECRTFMVSNA